MEGARLESQQGQEHFSSPTRPDRLWGSPSLLFSGYMGSFAGIEQLGCDADNSPPPRVEVKNEWGYTSTPPIRLDGVDSDNFHLYLRTNSDNFLALH